MHTTRHSLSSVCSATRARRRRRVQCLWAEVCYDRGNYRTDMPHRAVKVGRSARDVNCKPVVACVHARGCTAFLTCVRTYWSSGCAAFLACVHDATSCAQVGDKLSWRLADGRIDFSVNDAAVGTIFAGLDAATVYAGFFVGVGVVLRAEYTCWGR